MSAIGDTSIRDRGYHFPSPSNQTRDEVFGPGLIFGSAYQKGFPYNESNPAMTLLQHKGLESGGCLSPLAEGRTMGFTLAFFYAPPLFNLGPSAVTTCNCVLIFFYACVSMYNGFHAQTMWMTMILYFVASVSSALHCALLRRKVGTLAYPTHFSHTHECERTPGRASAKGLGARRRHL